jgi:hypothetical protein
MPTIIYMGTSDDVMIPRPARQDVAQGRSRRRPRWLAAITGGGADGNEQLTTIMGAILIVLLAVIGFTIPQLRQFISVHLFVGMLLICPVLLKMASTGYRFIRYYSGNAEYRAKGPPELVLRLLGPIVVLTTVVVFVTGVALLIVGPAHRDPWLMLHKVSFIVWVAFMSLHILGHLPAVGRALGIGRHGSAQLAGASSGTAGRWIAIAGALVAGLVLALLLIPDYSAWTSHGVFVHHHHG